MRRLLLMAFLGMLCLGLGLALSCATGDDDDSGGSDDDAGDDDAGDDDDDGGGDDDDASGNLTWQDPPLGDTMTWEEAISYCDELSFDGHDDWRLPTISELRSLIRGCVYTETGGDCNVTDDCLDSSCWNESCDGCASLQGPCLDGAYCPDGMSGTISWYWSSSPVADYDLVGYAWLVGFHYGYVNDYYVLIDYGDDYYVRCVRS